MKKIISFLIIISIFGLSLWNILIVNADPIPWESAVNECIKAFQDNKPEKMWSIVNPFNPKLSLSCAWNSSQNVAYQAILDVRFSKIDQEIEKYLKWLEWKTNSTNLLKEMSDNFSTTSASGMFYSKYVTACNNILEDAVKIAWDIGFTIDTTWLTKDMVKSSKWESRCLNLAKMKLNVYSEAWVVIIAREAAKSYAGSQVNYFSAIRKKYEKLLFKLLNYISELWVIMRKWNTSTPEASNE